MSNLENFNNVYANLAESAYNNRPNRFPYKQLRENEQKILDSGQSIEFDFSKDATDDNGNLTLGGTNLPNDSIIYLQPDPTLQRNYMKGKDTFYEESINSAYLNTDWLNKQLTMAMQAQERTAILTILEAKSLAISNLGTSLSELLHQKETEIKTFTRQSMVSNLKEGLTGKSAEAASEHLSSLEQPELKSPIKGV